MMYRSILVVALFLLGACGGGGSNSGGGATGGGTTSGGGTTGGGGVTPGTDGFGLDTGIGGSGGVIGDIDGFGSILMNGLTLNTDDAEFFIEGESGFSQDDLSEGQYVVVAGDVTGSIAEEVVYRSNLRGTVSADPVALDPLAGVYQLTVLDQTVLTSASTRFEDVLAENIVSDDLLEVSGPIDEQGRVLATYVSLKTSLPEYKAIGRIGSLDAGARTFELGGLLVDYGTATLSDFDGEPLADGQLVEVEMAAANFAAGNRVEVSELELLPEAQLREGAEVEIEAVIDSFVDATEFTVGGLPVTTDAVTEFEGGVAGQLGLNVKVEVEGTVNASGVIVAEKVEFEDDLAIRVEGAVTAVDLVAGTVTAMDLTFELRASTEVEDDRDGVELFSLDDLLVGDFIEVRGFLDGTTIVAVELEREESPQAGDFRTLLRGTLTAAPDETANALEIQGVTVIDDGNAEYEDQREQPISRTDFYALLETGTEVKAEWDDFTSFADPADTLSLEEDGD